MNDPPDPVVVAVQRVDHVVGKQLFGKRRKSSDVHKKDCDLSLLAGRLAKFVGHAPDRKFLVLVIEDESTHRRVARDTGLARQSNHRLELKMHRDLLLGLAPLTTIFQPLEDRCPTRRASGIAATGVREFDADAQGRLQDCLTRGHLDGASIRQE